VPGGWDDEQIAGGSVPACFAGDQPDSSVQDVDSRFAGILVLVERLACSECDKSLPQDVFVAAVDGVGTASAGSGTGLAELVSYQCGER
jgi:hypothetical protein